MQPYNPIEHIVIIVKENHSFDNYFGSFPGANGAKQPRRKTRPSAAAHHTITRHGCSGRPAR